MVTFAAGLRTPFARYWLSGFLADFGDGVRLAAFPLLAVQLTRSPAAVAAVTAVQGLPWLLLGGGLGVLVDRTDRRRLMVAVDVSRAAVIAALAAAILAHSAGLWLIYLTAFVTGTGSALRDITLVAGLVSALDAAWFAVLVLYVVRDLHQQPGAYGLLLAIGALGGVAAGGLGAVVTRRLGPWRSLLLGGAAMAASQAGLGLTSNVIVAAAMLFISSGAWALFNVTAVTMRQRQVPAAVLGRVSSLFGIFTRGTEALGAIAGGALAATTGIRAPMLAGAPPLAVAVAVLAWRHRRRAGRA